MTKAEMDKLALLVEELQRVSNDQSKKMDRLLLTIEGSKKSGIDGLVGKIDALSSKVVSSNDRLEVFIDNKKDFVEMREMYTHWRWFIKGAKWWISGIGLGTIVNFIMNLVIIRNRL